MHRLLELKDQFTSFFVTEGFRAETPSTLLSPVFPNDFNMSAGHRQAVPALLNRERLSSQLRLCVVERCIRRLDQGIVGYSPSHLTFFEMAAAIRLEPSTGQEDFEEFARSFCVFCDSLGLSRQRLVVTCSAGGRILDQTISPDHDGYNVWIRQGLVASRVVMVRGRRNLVYTVGENRPAGIGHEIFYPVGDSDGTLMEIASINAYSFILANGRLERTANRAVGLGVGVERLAVVAWNLQSVFQLPNLSSILGHITKNHRGELERTLYWPYFAQLADRTRALIFAIADGQQLDGSPRGRTLSSFLKAVDTLCVLLGLEVVPVLEGALEETSQQYEQDYPHLARVHDRLLAAYNEWGRRQQTLR